MKKDPPTASHQPGHARMLLQAGALQGAIAPGFEAPVFKAAHGIDDIHQLTMIREDGTRLGVKQTVYNLLSNAVRLAVEGGKVALHAARVPREEGGRKVETGANHGRSFPLGGGWK